MIEIKCNNCDNDRVVTTEEIMSEDMIECGNKIIVGVEKVSCNTVILVCDDELKMQINEVFNV